MYRYWAILTILFLFPLAGHGNISQSECGEYDFSENFPTVRDQNGVGYCWAFAGTALIEEELCKETKKPGYSGSYQCGDKLSVLDMSRCDFRLGTDYNDGEGGNASSGLNCILKENPHYLQVVPDKLNRTAHLQYLPRAHRPGMCLESFAPFNNLRQGFKGFIDANARGLVDSSSMNEYLAGINNKCQERVAASPMGEESEQWLQHYEKVLERLLPLQKSLGVDFKQALSAGYINEEFLRKILIPPQCSENRLIPKRKLQVFTDNFKGADVYSGYWDGTKTISKYQKMPDKSIQEKLTAILGAFKLGQSVAASICFKQYSADEESLSKLKASFQGPINKDDCGGHAIVYQGMRWNQEKKRCEILVRNSWGKGAIFHGWEDAQLALKHTSNISYLKPVEP